jgi:hypothetical protein
LTHDFKNGNAPEDFAASATPVESLSPQGVANRSRRSRGAPCLLPGGAVCRLPVKRPMKKWPFLINNGRTNIVWQSA